MSSALINNSIRDAYLKLVKEADAVIPSRLVDAYTMYPAQRDNFFDLDKLWAQPQFLNESSKLLTEIMTQIDQSSPFDTIVVWLSRVGSVGPIPQAAIIAAEMKKNLVIVREAEVQSTRTYPSTSSNADLLRGKKVLIFKDIVLRAFTFGFLAKLVIDAGATISAALVMLEVESSERLPLDSYLRSSLKNGNLPMVVSIIKASQLESY